jgi:hypothetical protein
MTWAKQEGMRIMDGPYVAWRKSSASGGDGGNCVEVASIGAVRDSKNPAGPVLRADLTQFLAAVRLDRLSN